MTIPTTRTKPKKQDAMADWAEDVNRVLSKLPAPAPSTQRTDVYQQLSFAF